MSIYYVRGDDGEEYGPSELEELTGWLKENRVGTGTLVRKDTTEGPWLPWDNFAELVALKKVIHATALFPDQPTIVPADILSRITAYIIDMLLVGLPLGIGLTVFLNMQPQPVLLDSDVMWQILMSKDKPSFFQSTVQFLSFFGQIAYFTYFHAKSGQTPGKRWLGIRVVNEQGNPLTWYQAFLRSIGLAISTVTVYLGCILGLFNKNHRTFHDFLARTYVVRG